MNAKVSMPTPLKIAPKLVLLSVDAYDPKAHVDLLFYHTIWSDCPQRA